MPPPPQERRRLGKTHGRARKTGGEESTNKTEGNEGRTPGTDSSQSPLVTPGGPGQGKPRKHTLSIAIPGSVVDNAQNRELKTYLVRCRGLGRGVTDLLSGLVVDRWVRDGFFVGFDLLLFFLNFGAAHVCDFFSFYFMLL